MKILFIYQELGTFVQKDLDILCSAHEVCSVQFTGRHGMIRNSISDLWRLWQGALWCDLTFSWFGKFHAFFAVLLSRALDKKAVVVAGGDDVAYEPEIDYGMFAYWWKKWCPLFAFRYADLILSVSKFNQRETIENAKAEPAKISLLYHGFDAQRWQSVDGVEKENLVLTVGGVTGETFRKKGLDLFVQSAAYLPNALFALVGPWQGGAIEQLKAIAPPNVTFTGGVYGEDLLRMYSRAKVYVQVSRHESFGCAVAEAMLCECVPLVTRRAALPEVVGDCGFYVDELTSEAVAERIKQALQSGLGPEARQRIQSLFPLERRREQLLAAIAEVGVSS